MRTFIAFVLMFFLACCNNSNVLNPYGLSEKQLHAEEAIVKALVQLKKDKELYHIGHTKRMLNQIKMLGLSFRYYKSVDITQSRELLTYCALLFLNIINESKGIRSYLESYPFKPENIAITIYLQNPDGSEPALEELTIVEVLDGKLKYLIKNLETRRFTTVYEETFEEAIAKLPEKIAI